MVNLLINEIKSFVSNTIISQEKILYKSYGTDVINKHMKIVPIAVADYLNKVYEIYYHNQNDIDKIEFMEIQNLFKVVNDNTHNILCVLEIIMNLIINIYKVIDNDYLCVENINLYIHSLQFQIDKILLTTTILLQNLLNHSCKNIKIIEMNPFQINTY